MYCSIYNIFRTKLWLRLALAAAILWGVSCSEASLAPNGPNGKRESISVSNFALVEVTISGIGTGQMSAQAVHLKPNIAYNLTTPGGGSGDGSIQLEPLSIGSFTYGERGSGGMRYFYATFKVRNAQSDGTAYGTTLDNLTFLAVDTDDTYGTTAISELRLFDGTLLSGSTAENIANATIPTGWVGFAAGSDLMIAKPDVLQIFKETEVSAVTTAPSVVNTIFPYGFVTRSPGITPGSRALPALPSENRFDGRVTFAFKIPLQTSVDQDPFKVSAIFLPVDDSETRVTQSLEEQTPGGQTALKERINTLSPTVVTLLPGSTFWSPLAQYHCVPVRVAGPVGSPTATLFPAPPNISSLTPDPYPNNGSASNINANTDFTAVFSSIINEANARSFVVRGRQSGVQFLGEIYNGNGTTTITTPTGSFFPGEIVEISLTPALGLCPEGQVVRYFVDANNGTGTFNTATNFPVGDGQLSVDLGDLNGDGTIDIVTANSDDNNVSVLLGDGTGNFTDVGSVSFPGATSPIDVELGDLNGDGFLDLVTGNSTDNISVFLGDGAGSFTEVANSPFTMGSNASAVALGDLNGDGDLDIVVAKFFSDNVSVLLGNGSGGFSGVVTNFTVSDGPRSVALGDLDGNGTLDIVTANENDDNVSVLLGNGSGGFLPATNYPVGNASRSVALGDFNGDGYLDLVTANRIDDNVSVLLGNGDGSFGTATSFGAGDRPASVAIGNLNEDNALDLVVVNNFDDNVSVFFGDGSGGFLPAVNFPLGDNAEEVKLGDLNGDGALDIITANYLSDNVSVLFGQL